MQIACPECHKQLKVPETAAGKKVKCPGCGEIFQALEEIAEEIQTETPAKRPRPAPPPVVEEDDERPRRRRDEEDEEPPPRSRRRRTDDDDEEGEEDIREGRRETRRPRDEEDAVEEEESGRSGRRRRREEEDEEEDYDDRPRRKRRPVEEDQDYDSEAGRKRARRHGKAAALWFLLAAIATLVLLAFNTIVGIYVLSKLPDQLVPNAQIAAQVATTVKWTLIAALLGCGVVEIIAVIFEFLARSSLTSLRGKGKVITAIVFAFILGTTYAIRAVRDVIAVVQPVAFMPKILTIVLIVLAAAAAFFSLFAAIKAIVTLNNLDVKKAFRRNR